MSNPQKAQPVPATNSNFTRVDLYNLARKAVTPPAPKPVAGAK
jgi:hypothetical protein